METPSQSYYEGASSLFADPPEFLEAGTGASASRQTRRRSRVRVRRRANVSMGLPPELQAVIDSSHREAQAHDTLMNHQARVLTVGNYGNDDPMAYLASLTPYAALLGVGFLWTHLMSLFRVAALAVSAQIAQSSLRVTWLGKFHSGWVSTVFGCFAMVLGLHHHSRRSELLNYMCFKGSAHKTDAVFGTLLAAAELDCLVLVAVGMVKLAVITSLKFLPGARAKGPSQVQVICQCRQQGVLLKLLDHIVSAYRVLLPMQLWWPLSLQPAWMATTLRVLYAAIKTFYLGHIAVETYKTGSALMQHREGLRRSTVVETAKCGHCPICQDPVRKGTTLPCSHVFCEECIGSWLARENSCPICRAQVLVPVAYLHHKYDAVAVMGAFPRVF